MREINKYSRSIFSIFLNRFINREELLGAIFCKQNTAPCRQFFYTRLNITVIAKL